MESIPTMPFVAGFKPGGEPGPHALCFGFDSGKILLKQADGMALIPSREDLAALRTEPDWQHYFGDWNESACWALSLAPDAPVPSGFVRKGLRELFGRMDEDLVWTAGRAGQFVHWHRNHRFCGRDRKSVV